MKVLLISYHYHPHSNYRSSLVHEFFKKHLNPEDSYKFLHADWDHQSKTRFEVADTQAELVAVPAYHNNLSLRRIWSHVVFSWKIFCYQALNDADLVYVCVPPSLSALGAALRVGLRGKKWVLDLVDLWPEALPVARWKKRLLRYSFGWVWVRARNALYARASLFVSHCQYFLDHLPVSPARSHFIPLAQAQEEVALLQKDQRKDLSQELRILVLGSINHVLESRGLMILLKFLSSPIAQASSPRPIVLEILGAGESKGKLLESLQSQAPSVQVIDHGFNFDPLFKREVLARCHFGYNGYNAHTAIGITYKSIDFASQGLVFLNSVQGDLRACVKEHHAGFNYHAGEETLLASKLMRLSNAQFELMSQGSRRLYETLFTLEGFEERMRQLLKELFPEARSHT